MTLHMQFRKSGIRGDLLKFHYFDFISAIEDGLNGYLGRDYSDEASDSIDDIEDQFGGLFQVAVMPSMSAGGADVDYHVTGGPGGGDHYNESYESSKQALDRALEILTGKSPHGY